MDDGKQDRPESNQLPEDPGQQPLSQSDREAQPVDDEQPPRLPFAVVGVGASAGGLEAFSAFLKAMRPDSGMAFVFILHLPPDHHSLVAEVLSRHTKMRVAEANDGMAIKPNHVYVIAPAHVLTIKDGRLHWGPRLDGPRAANRPVDDFFKSLAQEQRERAIAIIMSGMGSNGSAGCQAIKAVGGLCIAQDPESAQFPSMPRHLIDAGYADFIVPPAEMPEVLLQYASHPYASGGREADADAILQREKQHLREIMAVLRTRMKHDFSGYKKPTVLRRIQRRMGLARVTQLGEYAKMLRQSPGEASALADDLLIHVTGFFRDSQAWETLRERVIVPLIAGRENNASVRCWVAACSSGEEAYSLAMLLVEEAERADKFLDIKVFATDMADRTLTNARNGIYPGGIEADILPDRLARFFEKDDSMYRVRQDLRERVVFAPQNLLQDPPFSRLDIATCRNLLIYLEPDVQRRVLSLLHFGLREGGTLFLGTSETLGGAEELFEPLDKKARIFRRVGPTRHGMVDFPLPQALRAPRVEGAIPGGNAGGNGGNEITTALGRRPGFRPSFAQLTQHTLFENQPAAVLVDRDHRIVYYHGDLQLFLGQSTGEPTRDVIALAREGVRGAVRMALHRATAGNETATSKDAWVETEPGRRSRVHVTALPVVDRTTGEYFVVSFDLRGDWPEADSAASTGESGAAMAADMRRMRDELQSTIEELQSSNEELKASHEEVISINEELQSSNEELETSKEEMQSLNEELSTVNAQLRAKMEEHQAASNDLSSLLTSTDIAVLFLDTRFRIRRFTPPTRALLDLISSDVGRPLSDMARKFDDPALVADAEAVLARLVPAEREVTSANGRWFLRRATPYRTADNRIDGVVITFVDITERRRTEEALRASEEQFRRSIEDAPIPVIMQTQDGEVLQVSRTWTELTGYALSDVPTADAWLSRAYGPGADAVRGHMHELFKGDRKTLDVEFVIRTRDGADRHWSFSASAPGSLRDGRRFMVGMAVDVTDRRRAQEAVRESEERLRLALHAARMGTWTWDVAGNRHTRDENLNRMLGLEPVSSTQPLEEFFKHIHPEDVQAVRTAFNTSVRHGRPLNTEFRVVWPDGTVRWLKDQGEVFPKEGSPYMAGACIDITERRAGDMALRDSEERLRLVVEGARDFAMLLLDKSGRITAWNTGAERLLGFAEIEVVGQPAAIIFTPEDKAAGVPEKELAQASAAGHAEDERWHVRKNGRRFWGSGVMTALRDPKGSIRGFVKILRDETARKQAEGAEKAALEAAELANRTKDEFLATLSHELRTPLSAILLWANMLDGKSKPQSLNEGLAAIRNSADAQKQLIEDLLDTSRITSGKLRLGLKPTELAAVVDSAVESVLPAAQAKGVNIVKEVDPKAGVVRVDPHRMNQVLWNLLANAVKFTPGGGNIEVKLRRRDQDVELRVTDNGKGITADFLPHVFEPFRQAESTTTRSHSGLGLGLAICKKLVEQHGGAIVALSDGPGRGSTFIVTLPAPVLPAAASSQIQPVSSAKEQTRLGGVHVLLVEDEPETRDALATAIRQARAIVTPVESAAAAVEAYEKSKFDLLISDIGMPGEDGYSLIRRIRSIEAKNKSKRTPALALTAFVSNEDQHKAMAAGFDYHIGKPIEPEQLLSTLRKMVQDLMRGTGEQ